MDRLLRKAGRLSSILAVFCLVLVGTPWAQGENVPVDDETCLTCHENYDRALRLTAHALSSQLEKPAQTMACVSCHSNGSVHMEDPTVDNIGNPSRMIGADAIAACTPCHQPHHAMGTAGIDVHAGQEMACTDCHGIHAGYEGLLVDEEAGFCAKCHSSTVNQFRSRSNHPASDGNVTCLSCHDFTGKNEPAVGHGPSVACLSCHQEVSGPFLHEHEATSSLSTEGDGGCVTCHRPHGSPNERLLTQTGDALCLQCHGVPPLHRTFHNGIGAQYGCIECHSAVHGSDSNKGLLDESLGTKLTGDATGCFCHNVDN